MAHYWTRIEGVVEGPFDVEHIRTLAAQGRLRPDELISPDGTKWFKAAKARNLVFPERAGGGESESTPIPPPPAPTVVERGTFTGADVPETMTSDGQNEVAVPPKGALHRWATVGAGFAIRALRWSAVRAGRTIRWMARKFIRGTEWCLRWGATCANPKYPRVESALLFAASPGWRVATASAIFIAGLLFFSVLAAMLSSSRSSSSRSSGGRDGSYERTPAVIFVPYDTNPRQASRDQESMRAPVRTPRQSDNRPPLYAPPPSVAAPVQSACGICAERGYGRTECFTCKGSGLDQTYSGLSKRPGEGRICMMCDGRRFAKCQRCNGTGRR